MTTKAVYLPNPVTENGLFCVIGSEHHHLRVSRVKKYEAVEVFDGRGQVWEGEIVSFNKSQTFIRVIEKHVINPPKTELILVQSLIKPGAFEWTLEKAVEVGVTRIVPIRAARSNVAATRVSRWQRIILEAAKQSKRYWLPSLEEVLDLNTALEIPAKSKIMFAEGEGTSLKLGVDGSPVLYLIGPEGGWTDDECKIAKAKGATAVHLDLPLMRSETASIVAAALLQYELELI